MLVMMRRDNDPREHARLLVAGVVYLVTVALLVALAIAVYLKAFTPVTKVTLVAERAGLQLAELGDVRFNGVLVGQVRDISQTGDEARIVLALEPESARAIPGDVEAEILPTTLFGQKYVALVPGATGGPAGLRDGTVIPPERVHTSVELSRVLNRLFPLLRSVRPADLSATLSALATALNGRGEEIGSSLDRLDTYLTAMNVHLPTLQEDLRLVASVADTYRVSADDLLAALADLTVTARTVRERRADLPPLLDGVTSMSGVGADLLEQNEVNAIRATRLSVPLMALLEKYSPEYNCLLRGIAAYKPVLADTFEGGRVKQFIEFPTTQVRGYDQRDIPEYTDKRGPRCWGLPDNPPVPWPGLDLSNGTNLDSRKGRGNSYFPAGAEPGPAFVQELLDALVGIGYDGPARGSERRTTNAVLSARTGLPADTIPALSTLLYGPMVRQPAPDPEVAS